MVFTKNITEAINLFAYSWGRANLHEGDAIVVTEMEHHANIVPWHILCAERGVELRWVPIDDDFRLDLSELDRLLDGAKLFAFTAMSNVLGTVNDVRFLADAAHAAGATVLVDAAQAVPHGSVDVQAWDADFVGFTGHKMLGPSGIGGFWARPELLEAMPPFLGGGEMILDVRKDGYVPNEVPWKFEAGTMPIAEATGLAAAIDYLEALGMDAVREHERHLTQYTLQAMRNRFDDRIHVHGPSGTEMRGGIISFGFDHIHAHDISQVLDEDAICVRASHHCAKPLMRVLGVPANTASVVLRLQRRSRCRRTHRRARARREVLRHLGGQGDTMPGLEDLYREIILDHYRAPRNRGELPVPPAHKAEGFNPLCGDEVVLYLDVDGDTVTDLKIAGQGCSISQASTSMMSAAVKGLPVAEARKLIRAFKALMSIHESKLEGEADGEDLRDDLEGIRLGDLEALQGVVKFPVRIKCATLAWNTLQQGLDEIESDDEAKSDAG